MSTITIIFNEDEDKDIEDAMKIEKAKNASAFIKAKFLEKLEDDEDLRAMDEVLEKEKLDPNKRMSFEDAMKLMSLNKDNEKDNN